MDPGFVMLKFLAPYLGAAFIPALGGLWWLFKVHNKGQQNCAAIKEMKTDHGRDIERIDAKAAAALRTLDGLEKEYEVTKHQVAVTSQIISPEKVQIHTAEQATMKNEIKHLWRSLDKMEGSN